MHKVSACLVALALMLAVSLAAPQGEGAAYSREAILQAQNTHLIPKDAEIQKVEPGIELAAVTSIPGNQRINLSEVLGDLPEEVIAKLQRQIDQIGPN